MSNHGAIPTLSVGFSLSFTKLEILLEPGDGLRTWMCHCPTEILDRIYDALAGPLSWLTDRQKYTFALDLMSLVYRHVHYVYGNKWYQNPLPEVYYVIYEHLHDLVMEYLRLYGSRRRVNSHTGSGAGSMDGGDTTGDKFTLDLDNVYTYELPAFTRTFSEPNLLPRARLDHEENRLRAKRRAAEKRERWLARVAAIEASLVDERRKAVFIREPSLDIAEASSLDEADDESGPVPAPEATWAARFKRLFKRFQNFGQILAYRQAKLQSGKAVAKQKRQERDEHQRATAKEKTKALWKGKDKRERQNELQTRRDARYFEREACLWADERRHMREAKAANGKVELQSGIPQEYAYAATALAGVGVGIAAYKLFESLRKVDNVTDSLSDLVTRLRSFGAELRTHLGAVLWVVPLVMVVHYYMSSNSALSEGVAVMLTSAVATVVGPELWKRVAEFFRLRQNVLQSGGAVDVTSFMSVTPKLLITLFLTTIFKNRFSPWMMTDLMTKVAGVNRAHDGWETFLKWMLDALETAVNYVRKMFGAESIQMFKDQHTPMKLWALKVTGLVGIVESGGTLEPEQLDGLVDVIREGHEYRTFYMRSPSLHRVVEEVLMRAVTTLMPLAGALNARDNFRVEPSVLILHGKPGIGKTMMSMHLCSAIMIASGLVKAEDGIDALLRNIWQKGNSEFWNGYCRQLCLILDDVFQRRVDPKDMENDYMTIIRAASSWAFPLNFADLASKGKIYFGSKFIFGSTNLASIASEAGQCVHGVDAVLRRINHPYTLKVNPAFALPNGMLDYQLFAAERERVVKTAVDPMDAYPWHVWNVQKHDFLTGKDLPGEKSLKSLIVEISAELRGRVADHGDARAALADFVAGFAPKLQSGFERTVPLPSKGWFAWMAYGQAVGNDMNARIQREIDAADAENAHCQSMLKRAFGSLGVQAALWTGASCLVLYGVFKLIRCVLTGLWSFITQTFGAPVRKTQSNRKVTVPAKTQGTAKVLQVDPTLQSSSDATRDNIYANSYKMHVDLKCGTRVLIGQTVFVESDLAVQPTHFTVEMRARLAAGVLDRDSKVVLRNCANKEHTFSYTVEEFLSFKRFDFEKTEVQFVKFKCANAHRSIRKNFIVESDIGSLKARGVVLDVCDVDKGGVWSRDNHRRGMQAKSVAYRPVAFASGVCLGPCFFYDLATQQGDCGAPLSLVDNRLFGGRTCMGIHVAGDAGMSAGYSVVVTQGHIERAAKHLNIIKDAFVEDLESSGVTLQSSYQLPFAVEGSFLPLYKVSQGVNIAPKTAYYKTFLHGRMGEYTDSPAPMGPVWRDGALVYPMDNAVKPYSTPLVHYSQDWLKQAMHVAMRPFVEASVNSDRSIYTFEQAVKGIPTRKFRSVPRSTSAGYPFVLKTKATGKKSFFGDEAEYDLTREEAIELEARVGVIESMAKQGTRSAVVFMDFLKDELRSVAKVEAVATRLISSAPIDYTLAWRKYFGAFSSEIMHFNLSVGMAPGMCSYTDTGKLAEVLSSKGMKCFDGDFKGFDASEQPCVHDLCLEFVNEWYSDGEENALVRRVLWMDLVHSRHIGGRGYDQAHIYQWNKSLPSGHPFTTIVNSMYSLFMLVAAYISITGDKVSFWEFVAAVTYGDDNVANVADCKADEYNQVSVSEALAREFGLVYTSGDKTGEMVPYKNMWELTFLKRSIRLEDNRWLCPLELNSFLFTHYWGRNRKFENTILEDVLENGLEELSMHPSDAWDKYAPALKECLAVLGKTTRLVFTRKSYQDRVLLRIDNWY